MCPIFIEYSFLPINVSNFHIVLIFTNFNEYYTQIVAFFSIDKVTSPICV